MRAVWIAWALAGLQATACDSHDTSVPTASGHEGGGQGIATAGDDAAASNDAAGGDGAGAGGFDAASGPEAGRDAAGDASPGALHHAWDWTGIIGTGQSLSVGVQAPTATLTQQPFANLKLSLGTATLSAPPYDANDPALSVVPLVEPIRALASTYPSAYPSNIYGETPHTAMADQISSLFQKDGGGDYVTVHTVVGESGQGIHVIDKTATVTSNMGHAYAGTLFEVAALKRLAASKGKTYGVAAVVLTHGETDAGNTSYESDMYRLLTDYDQDVAAITGQTSKILLLTTQQQTSPTDNSTQASILAEWKVGLDHPSDAVCVGPKYQYPYASDHLHLVAKGYDQLGEKYAEVYYQRIVLGADWQPLQPISATLAGKVITVKFHVPAPPLAWDTSIPAPHQGAHTAWAQGKGFEVQNQSGEQTIGSVAIQGDSVAITLASAPATTGLVVRYAITQDGSGNLGGLATGRVGQLRDSDPLVGYATKLPQYNYAVSFTLPAN
jgi:hypothetical protein